MEKSILYSLFPELRDWIYIELKDNSSLEDSIRSQGKWIVYGSKNFIENLASILKAKIGMEINALKYSTVPVKVTPNAPEGSHALIVYCNERKKEKVRDLLEEVGIKEANWKSDKESLAELIEDPLFCLRLELLNPGRLNYLTKLIQKDVRPEILEEINRFKRYIKKLAKKFKNFESDNL